MSKFKNCLIYILLIIFSSNAQAIFYKNTWSKWEINNPLSTKIISHQLWQDFLNRRIINNEENINLVDYAHITPKDLILLKEYLDNMTSIKIDKYNRKEQLAYWINVYNALTVQIIAKYYPVSSIQEINISPGLFSVGPWGAKLIKVNGASLTLDDINNRIIRPIWNDVRVHYALNDGSIGCPNLSRKVYEGNDIDNQLNSAAFTYINSLRGVNIIEGRLIVSKLFEWYEEDYGDNKNDIIAHLSHYAKEPLRSQLKHINTIDSYIYNWHINSTSVDVI